MSQNTESTKTWADTLIEEYRNGASDIEVCDALGVSRAYFDSQYSSDPVWKELIDLGRQASTAWWYRWGRKNLLNKSANTALWNFNMKNRFGWAEKSESTSNTLPTEQKTLEELQTEIMARIPGLVKRGILGKATVTDAQVLDFPTKAKDVKDD